MNVSRSKLFPPEVDCALLLVESKQKELYNISNNQSPVQEKQNTWKIKLEFTIIYMVKTYI